MSANASAPFTSDDVLRVVIYSDNRLVREQIKLALGRKIASDLPELEITEFATPDAMLKVIEKETFDAAVFDAEARPGGMGISHQMRDEIPNCPPVVLLIARAADAWMATWSRAEGISPYPVDPIRLPDDVARVVRNARMNRTDALSSSLVEPGVGSRHPIAN
ncbi:MAG: response regulator transcription factor [Propionibacterium sp.]|nr:response regulator transcription factor [Propionibacterium sp.]